MDASNNQDSKFPDADRIKNLYSEEIKLELSKQDVPAPTHIEEAIKSEHMHEADKGVSAIHTFQSDVASAMKDDNVSMIKIALAESKRKNRQGTFEEKTSEPKNTKKIILITIGAIVTLIVVAVGFYIFLNLSAFGPAVLPSPTSPQAQTAAALMYSENTTTIDLSGKTSTGVQTLINRDRAGQLPIGSVTQVLFTQSEDSGATSTLDTADWFGTLDTHIPQSLLQTFDPNFFFGLYGFTPNESIILLKINDYDNAYAGMIQWEPYMETDIGSIMEDQHPTSNGSSDALSTNTSIFQPPFTDQTISNKDARVLLDSAGNVKMLYMFVDEQTLLIASGPVAAKEAIFRLTTGRITR